MLFSLRSSIFVASITLFSLTAATPVDGDGKTDWKYAVGWDGSVLDAAEIGAPVGPASNGTSLTKRTVGGVYICEDINWGGKCGYAVQPLSECIKLGGDWNKKISSFGPDPCTSCVVHDDAVCGKFSSGMFWGINYPGDATGGLGSAFPWNDKISSFNCFYSDRYC